MTRKYKVGDLIRAHKNTHLRGRSHEILSVTHEIGSVKVRYEDHYHYEPFEEIRLSVQADFKWKKVAIECEGHGQEVAEWLAAKTEKKATSDYSYIARVGVSASGGVHIQNTTGSDWPEENGYFAMTYAQWLTVTGKEACSDSAPGKIPVASLDKDKVGIQVHTEEQAKRVCEFFDWEDTNYEYMAQRFGCIGKGAWQGGQTSGGSLESGKFCLGCEIIQYSDINWNQDTTPPPTQLSRSSTHATPAPTQLSRSDAHDLNLGDADFTEYVRANRATIEATSMMQVAVDDHAALVAKVKSHTETPLSAHWDKLQREMVVTYGGKP